MSMHLDNTATLSSKFSVKTIDFASQKEICNIQAKIQNDNNNVILYQNGGSFQEHLEMFLLCLPWSTLVRLVLLV